MFSGRLFNFDTSQEEKKNRREKDIVSCIRSEIH